MQIRGSITHEALEWSGRNDRPIDDSDIHVADESNVFINLDLNSPENAVQLARIRAHCIENPQGVLLDVYQDVTGLELRYEPGTEKARDSYVSGLRGELTELSDELMKAQIEHPYLQLGQTAVGPEDTWLNTVLDFNRLRFNDLKSERKSSILSETGDVLWYSSRLAAEEEVSLSKSFVTFLRRSKAGALPQYYELGAGDEIEKRAQETMDFRLTQDIALSQKQLFSSVINEGTSVEKVATIDNMPSTLLNRIIEDDLIEPIDTEMLVGKLLWFTAYTSNSILNADYCLVMKANLEKILTRSKTGTVFSKQHRQEADETTVHGGRNPRQPMG